MTLRISTDTERFLIVGAGFSGAVLARSLADAGFHCDVFEENNHVGGHCHTARDRDTGVLVHRQGPHTLHSDDAGVWEFIEQFTTIHPYRHLKRAKVRGELYPLPINLQTVNQFFRTALGPNGARAFIEKEAEPFAAQLDGRPPANFEEAGLAKVGRRLYEAFYRGYTIKQWGKEPKTLPASVFSRVPIRFNYDWNYFRHARQGQPVGGYTLLVERILAHENISVHLGRPLSPTEDTSAYRHVFYSGPIDRFFDWRHGRLPYRTLRFEDVRQHGDVQACDVVNYCDDTDPHTRVTEHKHFSAGWETHEDTILSYEYSADCGPDDVPYYPLRLAQDETMLAAYVDAARRMSGVSFIGRLGTYRYIDMDVAIREATEAATATATAIAATTPIPVFFVEPTK